MLSTTASHKLDFNEGGVDLPSQRQFSVHLQVIPVRNAFPRLR